MDIIPAAGHEIGCIATRWRPDSEDGRVDGPVGGDENILHVLRHPAGVAAGKRVADPRDRVIQPVQPAVPEAVAFVPLERELASTTGTSRRISSRLALV